MSTTPNTQAAISASNLAAEYEQARLEAKRGASRAKVAKGKDLAPAARVPAEPVTNMDAAMMAAQIAELRALVIETNAQNTALVQQMAVLKAAKPGKAEKTQPQPENEVISVKGNTLTITVDLGKDLGTDTKSGARREVAKSGGFGFYNFDHKGVRYSLSCAVYHDNPNFEELDKAYKAAQKAAKN